MPANGPPPPGPPPHRGPPPNVPRRGPPDAEEPSHAPPGYHDKRGPRYPDNRGPAPRQEPRQGQGNMQRTSRFGPPPQADAPAPDEPPRIWIPREEAMNAQLQADTGRRPPSPPPPPSARPPHGNGGGGGWHKPSYEPREKAPYEPRDRSHFESREKLPHESREKAPYESREKAPYEPRDKPPYEPRDKPPYEPRDKPPYEPRGKGPHDSRDKPPYDSRDKPPYEPRDKPPYEPRDKPPYEPRDKPPYEPRNKPPYEPQDRPPYEPRDKHQPYEQGRKPPFEPEDAHARAANEPPPQPGQARRSSRFGPPLDESIIQQRFMRPSEPTHGRAGAFPEPTPQAPAPGPDYVSPAFRDYRGQGGLGPPLMPERYAGGPRLSAQGWGFLPEMHVAPQAGPSYKDAHLDSRAGPSNAVSAALPPVPAQSMGMGPGMSTGMGPGMSMGMGMGPPETSARASKPVKIRRPGPGMEAAQEAEFPKKTGTPSLLDRMSDSMGVGVDRDVEMEQERRWRRRRGGDIERRSCKDSVVVMFLL
ncbi:hypothetical protein DENSPDRAFT_494249 [Dentipellis sp. KUC8613]|nr:hypothetical protein DENSPDRAFT_494249 [Dentipellis sp. KUC8613]